MSFARADFGANNGHKQAIVIRGWGEELFPNSLKQRGYDVSVIDYKDVDDPGNFPLPENPDLVIARIFSLPEKGLPILERAIETGAKSSESMEAHAVATDKFQTFKALRRAGVATPLTAKITTESKLDALAQAFEKLSDAFGGDLVIKPINGNRGRGISFPNTAEEFATQVQEHLDAGQDIVVQKRIDSGAAASHYRVIVAGGEFITAKKFVAQEGKLVSNLSEGAETFDATLTDEQIALAEKASRTLDVTFAGVDLVVDAQTGETLVLEVNMTPNIVALKPAEQHHVVEKIIDITEHRDVINATKHMKAGWDQTTTTDPDNWSDANPAWGQCAVTASLICEQFGGELVRITYETPDGGGGSHYFNVLDDGFVLDATREQFPPGTTFNPPLDSDPQVFIDVTNAYVEGKDFQGSAYDYVVSFPATKERLDKLRENIESLNAGSPAPEA